MIVVHCKAGKGRTGLFVCCLLLHLRVCNTAEEALELFGSRRTEDGKGVTIPSQQRYVGYYHQALKNNLFSQPPPTRYITRLNVTTVPLTKKFGCEPYIKVNCKGRKVFRSAAQRVEKDMEGFVFHFLPPIAVSADVNIPVQEGQKAKKVPPPPFGSTLLLHFILTHITGRTLSFLVQHAICWGGVESSQEPARQSIQGQEKNDEPQPSSRTPIPVALQRRPFNHPIATATTTQSCLCKPNVALC